MSKFFIHRPIFAAVISIVIVIAGAVSFTALPVAKFPQISPPTVKVTAFYPGANAQTIAETVATTGRVGGADLTASPGFQGAGGMFRLLPDGTNQRALAIAQVTENQVAIIDPAPRRLGGPGL